MDSPKNWGATAAERARPYPCDALAFVEDDAYFRAIDIAAPPALVFRWLCQLRVAPYSYDLLDNFGRRSPSRLTPGLDDLAPGQRVMTIFRLVAFEAPRSLTIALSSRPGAALMGDFCGTYDVSAAGRGSRLLAKIRVRYPGGRYGRLLRGAMPWLDLVMFRKQLATLRRYAERDARAT
ncbi:MAG: hypothetical protein NVSMB19_04440 [Vulcanimicrobiaceae bacterium]